MFKKLDQTNQLFSKVNQSTGMFSKHGINQPKNEHQVVGNFISNKTNDLEKTTRNKHNEKKSFYK